MRASSSETKPARRPGFLAEPAYWQSTPFFLQKPHVGRCLSHATFRCRQNRHTALLVYGERDSEAGLMAHCEADSSILRTARDALSVRIWISPNTTSRQRGRSIDVPLHRVDKRRRKGRQWGEKAGGDEANNGPLCVNLPALSPSLR